MSGGTMGQSVVSLCDVTNCIFNQERQCHAGTIQVAFVDGMAHCATYTPESGAMGVGSTDVADTVSPGTMDEQRSSGMRQ